MRRRFKRTISEGDILIPHVDFDPETAIALLSDKDIIHALAPSRREKCTCIAISDEEMIMVPNLYPPMRKRVTILSADGRVKFLVLRIS